MTARMTPAQQRAVEWFEGDLAISAGAGSGKTTVLSHRFAAALTRCTDSSGVPAEVDRILTITFTNKAAGEIAERVRRVVNAEVSVDAGRRVSEAWISTIHTFCGRLVRRHVLESGVDPRFTQIDEVASALLKAEAFEAAAGRLYGAHEGATLLLDATALPTLRADVVAVHDNVRAMGLDPREARVPDGRDELGPLKSDVHRLADSLAGELEACSQTPSIIAKRTALDTWCAALGSCALGEESACDALLGLYEAYDIKRLTGDAGAANKELVAALGRLAQAASAAARSRELNGFEVLLHAFSEDYARLKAERSAIDFDDLQELAAALLESHPDLATRYREHFRLLMVDEFQDTNELQMRVLEPLRNDNLCVVGDERQSIYGFRYADVEIFERLRAKIPRREVLSHNFRSHPAILDFVNGAFAQTHLFGPQFMQLESGRTGPWDELVPEGAPRVECLFVDTGASSKGAAVATEAEAVASRISGLIESGMRGGDIAILLRNATNATRFAQALERHEVPVLVSAGVELFDAAETQELIWLLRAIAVPGDDEALTATLASRIVRLSDDALLALRLDAGSGPLWGALEAAAQGAGEGRAALSDDDAIAARKAYRVISDANSRQGTTALHELIHDVCEAMDYDLTLFSDGPQGLRAWANILKIVRYAEQYEAVESGDVAAFVEYLRQRGDGSKDKSAPAEAGEHVVRVMTVHAAKGLEFPVVFAADLGAQKCHSPGNALVSGVDAAGSSVPIVGVRLPSEDGAPVAATAVHQQLCSIQQQLDLEEQKRCLYVACTRAEELLVISGSTNMGVSAEDGKAIVDWIREALGDPGATSVVRCGEADIDVSVLEAAEPESMGERPTPPIEAPLAVDDGPRPAADIAPKRPRQVSYSSMHTHAQCPLSWRVRSLTPLGAFRNPAARTASDFGSALHEVMQSAASDAPSAGAVQSAARRHRLDEGDRERLQVAVSAFFASPLAGRLAECDRVVREEPIRVSVGATALVGNVDVLAWRGETALVVDYKTGRAPSGDEVSRETGYELQAKCYALAAFEAGASSVEAVFSFVEHGPREVSFSFAAGDAVGIREEIERRIEAMANDTGAHLPAYDADICHSCPALGGVCPIDPPDADGA